MIETNYLLWCILIVVSLVGIYVIWYLRDILNLLRRVFEEEINDGTG